ncbi:MAG: type II toxin-antitoxin system VapC family toxin [Spirochaetia bacterium]
MIFVDSNIPMYLIGAEHENKLASQRSLEHYITEGQRLAIDAEVLQEILHRYMAIGRPDAIQPGFDAILGIVDDVFPIECEDAEAAKDILQGTYKLSARDALHVAIMRRYDIRTILSFDSGFDGYPGLIRVPARLS